jgi:dynein light intermediate chain
MAMPIKSKTNEEFNIVPGQFKSKAEKYQYIKEEIAKRSKINLQRAQNITLINSLVKYDTPFLVSSTATNKKTLKDLEENEENALIYLRNIINKGDGEETEGFEFSVKDALNKILPPKKITDNDQIWVQYVTCTPCAKADVINLQEDLDRRLQTEQARETGICPIREKLYVECFDELIRQVTINCLERGILLMRIKKELIMTVESYQNLYESAIAYGIRVLMLAEEDKKKLEEEIVNDENECNELENEIAEIEFALKDHKEREVIERDEIRQKHKLDMEERMKKIKTLKEQLKEKLSFHSK